MVTCNVKLVVHTVVWTASASPFQNVIFDKNQAQRDVNKSTVLTPCFRAREPSTML